MAKVASITLTGPWSKLTAIMSPAVASGRIAREMGNATRANGAIVRKEIRRTLQRGLNPANAPLTVMIKGSSKPGVDSGELFKAITSVVIDHYTAEIGVRKGNPEADYARMLHDGGRIKVTQKMRTMFGYLADVSAGNRSESELTGRAAELYRRRPGGWRALRESTTHIRIPARPFIAQTMDDESIKRRIGRNWLKAWSAGLAGERFKI